MNTKRLHSLFDHIADAPDVVPRLRRFVLELAVRGKLVDQDPNDEPAEGLLSHATFAQTMHWKNSRSKSGSLTKLSLQYVGPYSIPQGWVWSTIGAVCSKTGSGSTPTGGKQAYKTAGVAFLRSQNIHNDGLRLKDVAFIDSATHERMSGTAVQSSDILLNITGGSIGRCCLVPNNFGPANVSQHVAIVRTAIDGLERFLLCFISAPFFQDLILNEQTGAGRGGLPKYKLDRFPVALPPLPEQRRIVSKVDGLMALCDKLEKAHSNREDQLVQLAKASYARLSKPDPNPATFRAHARFAISVLPKVTDSLDQIGQLRRTILNLAVRGKLVDQDPNDEPASDMLKRIALERVRLIHSGVLRKRKALPTIQTLPMDVPENWECVELGELFIYDAGIKRNPSTLNPTWWLLELEDIEKHSGRLLARRMVSSRSSKSTKSEFQKGDILLGKLRPYLNKVLVADADGYSTTEIVAIRPIVPMNAEYCAVALRRPDFVDYVTRLGQGTKMPRLRRVDALRSQFPLPPIAEQHRIVAKVDELLATIAQLATSIRTTHDKRNRLMESLLDEALEIRKQETI